MVIKANGRYFLRRCFETTYQVKYCNKGTVTADNVSLTLEFDPFLSVVSSSIPWTDINGNTYTFSLGDVPVGQCNDLSLGFVNQFPLDDQEGFIDIDCQANIGSYDPNDKHGFPLGTGDDHAITDADFCSLRQDGTRITQI